MKSMKMPTVMSGGHQFSLVPRAAIERSQFNRSHGLKTTMDAGFLVPIYVDEALPGDTFNLRLNAFVRLATPLKPIMDNLYVETFFFAVPNRLLWTNWQRFCGEQSQPGASTSYTIPQQVVPAAGYTSGCLQDYFGLPVGVAGGNWTHSALWTRAYYLVYNEWFRDENLCNAKSVIGIDGTFVGNDGPDTAPVGGCALVRRGKRHDYFTSCLPWPQKGTAVAIPLGTTAPVIRDPSQPYPGFEDPGGVDSAILRHPGGADPTAAQFTWSPAVPGVPPNAVYWGAGAAGAGVTPGLVTDLSEATAATINALREAFQVQKLLERDARGGTRYTEIVKAHFGVTSPDARLQRPEYLGGGSSPIIVSPIAQNSNAIDQETPQGNLAGIGTGVLSGGHGFVKSFTEHCTLIGLACIRADLTYQEGVDRMFSRNTRYDFYWPALAHIGEQGVLNQEIFLSNVWATDQAVFGYQERYAEYRYKQSRITGKFRSGLADTLDIWHLSQEFGALPTLAATFIQEAPPIGRVIAVPTEPQFLWDSFFELKCARPMPMFGVPGMIDHF